MAQSSWKYTEGTPPTVSVDINLNKVDLWISESQRDIHTCWQEQFAEHESITVLLSGGLDSQFSALLAKKYCADVKAVVFHFLWDHTTINAHDVLSAVEFAEHHNLDLQHVKIDLRHCLDNELDRLCKTFICPSPQIATQLYCVEQLMKEHDLSRTLLMGSEIPVISCDVNTLILPSYRSEEVKLKNNNSPVHFARSMLSFFMLRDTLGIKMIKDPFYMTPEILFLAHCHNATVFEKKQMIMDVSDPLKREITDYKLAYYDLLVDGLRPPLLKRTGFELLRYSMAVQSGVYNQFDLVYRAQAEQAVKSRRQRGKQILSELRKPLIHGPIDKVVNICQQALEQHRPKACNLYVFDW